MPAKMRIFLFLVMNMVFAFSALAQDAHKQVAEGNKLYQEGKYDEANNRYRDALVASPESPIINFNIGNVLYKKRNYEESVNAYEKVLSAEDVKLQAQSYYNLGNTHFRMGKLPESILYYKKAIKLNPEDEDAKYNLEYVRAKLKDEANKQQQNQNQNQNQDQQLNQQQEQQNQQDQEQQQNQEGQDEQDEQDESGQQRQEEQSQEQKQQSPQQQEISREDAERILNAVQNEEQDLLKDNRRKVRAQDAFR
ncbi:MAG: tetratricopeptide repeat protein, partial [Calditrichaeota bacterium]|nr:tetratricopeptide repeat protein [Calditrichota bacterium]